MRVTKYRAYDKFNNEWTYSEVMGLAAFFKDYEMRLEGDDNVSREEYTGLKDKNGVEIYEGDIVKDKYGFNNEVFYRNCAFRLLDKETSYPLDMFGDHSIPGKIKDIEIIGNIHETKEP